MVGEQEVSEPGGRQDSAGGANMGTPSVGETKRVRRTAAKNGLHQGMRASIKVGVGNGKGQAMALQRTIAISNGGGAKGCAGRGRT